MASTGSKRGASFRHTERQSAKTDDPLCLVCGVNLALDGRTFTVVSQHQNIELSDVFVRVLGMKFTQEQATITVCNRCERQLKRLGRTSSIAVARHEGRKFREQMETNLTKQGTLGVELGDFGSAGEGSSKFVKDGVGASSAISRSSNSSKSQMEFRRSFSGVPGQGKSNAHSASAQKRDRSAPERSVQKLETDESKDAKRRSMPRAYSANVERASSFRAMSTDRKEALVGKSQKGVSSVPKSSAANTKSRAAQEKNAVDLKKRTAHPANVKNSADASSNNNLKKVENGKESSSEANIRRCNPDKEENNHESWAASRNTNPFAADELPARADSSFEDSGNFDDQSKEDFDHSHEQNSFSQKQLLQAAEPRFRKSSPSSESNSDNEYNTENTHNKRIADSRKDYRSTGKQDFVNSGRFQDSQGFSSDVDRDQAKRFKVTFSESITIDEDVGDEQHTKINSGSPQSDGATFPVISQSVKGKILKYESLDLDMEKNNPFFDDVYGEYTRRVTAGGKARNPGQLPSNKRASQNINVIQETEVDEENEVSKKEGEKSIILNDREGEALRNAPHIEICSKTSSEDRVSARIQNLKIAEGEGRAQTMQNEMDSHVTGENQQDSTPLIANSEDNKEEIKEDENHEEVIVYGEESFYGSDGKEKALEESMREYREEHDPKDLEDPNVGAEVHKLDGEVIIPAVGTQMESGQLETGQLESGRNVEERDEGRDGEVSFVKEAPDGHDSQVMIQPLNAEGTAGTKSEASPLIDKDSESSNKKAKKGKDSKFKDQQPGFACCTIL